MKENLTIACVIVVLALASNDMYSQTDTKLIELNYKYSGSAQLNYAYSNIEELLWHDDNVIRRVYSFRFGYHINSNFSFGPEFSGWDRRVFFQDTLLLKHSSNMYLGGYARYSVKKLNFIKPFVDASIYYNYTWASTVYPWLHEGAYYRTFHRLGVYVAPGISICILKNRINLDLIYKFSNLYLANYKRAIFSWRLTYNFNVKGC
jgi:hypothetical protein